jgi:hypothetical protein
MLSHCWHKKKYTSCEENEKCCYQQEQLMKNDDKYEFLSHTLFAIFAMISNHFFGTHAHENENQKSKKKLMKDFY